MAREMAATVLSAGGAPAADPAAVPVAEEPESGGAGAATPEDSASPPAPAPEAEPSEAAPEGAPAPDNRRLKDTQAALHKAKAESKSLAEALAKLMPTVPAAPSAPEAPVSPMAPPAPVYGSGAVPTRQLPTGEVVLNIPLPMTEQDFEAAFQANSNRELDDRTAFRRSFEGLFQTYHDNFLRMVVPQLQTVFSQGTARELAVRSARARHGGQVKQQIEGYWKSVAPAIPARFMWTFAQEAAQQHPGQGPQAISTQAAYCLARALEEFGGAAAVYRPDHSDTNRVQDALLRPGEGGGARAARSGAATTTMVDQMRNAFRAVRGG